MKNIVFGFIFLFSISIGSAQSFATAEDNNPQQTQFFQSNSDAPDQGVDGPGPGTQAPVNQYAVLLLIAGTAVAAYALRNRKFVKG